jgi:hypothetical protein
VSGADDGERHRRLAGGQKPDRVLRNDCVDCYEREITADRLADEQTVEGIIMMAGQLA